MVLRGRLAAGSEQARRRWAALSARLPVWAVLLGIYAGTRVWGWAVFSLVARQQGRSPWSSGHLGYEGFIGIWDSDWYRFIAEHGYPRTLPVSPDGTVRQNPWAFYPLQPLAARGLMALGLDFTVAASVVSLLCGAVAVLLVHELFRRARRGARGRATGGGLRARLPQADAAAVVSTSLVFLSPVAPVLQTPYAESMNLMFLSGVLLAATLRRWWLVALLLPWADLSRPVGVPLAAALGLWWAGTVMLRLRARSGSVAGWAALQEALRGTGTVFLVALFSCATALLWPLAAWWATGRLDAYTATETAWRGEHLLPVQPWVDQARTYCGAAGPVVLVLMVLAVVWALSAPVVRRELSGPVRPWLWTYGAYLLLFLFPQSSTFRLLLPVFPVAGPLVALSRSRAYRALLLIGAGLGQLVWVGWLWHWKELPSGGDFPP